MSMNRTRRVLMVAFVATALCADRVVAAAPSLRTMDAMDLARRLAGRLVITLRHAVAAAQVKEVRRQGGLAAEPHVRLAIDSRPAAHDPAPLHRYRLPPPAC
ncbi:MAG: hypothetical protein ACHRHE_08310 [Tepidisphaerales bacterium]